MIQEEQKSKYAQDVRARWSTTPINGDSFSNLLKEYREYLHSDKCDQKQMRTDVVAVAYKNIIETFSRWFGLT